MSHGGDPGADDAERQRHLEHLRAVYGSLAHPPAAPQPKGATEPAAPHANHRKRNTALGGIGTAIAFALGKLKFLGVLAGALKLKTFATVLISIGVYATQWGWPFATGFVLLILVHEMGHVLVLHREGIPFGAPVFIPFVGAFVTMKGMPRNAGVEARVALGGPVLGSVAAIAVLAVGWFGHHPLLIAIGHAGVLINLFNLIPVSPLDGGRIAGAFTRGFWIAGYVIGVAMLVLRPSPILFLALLVGLWTLWQRWKHPVPGYDAIPRGERLAIGLSYLALVVVLAELTILTVPKR